MPSYLINEVRKYHSYVCILRLVCCHSNRVHMNNNIASILNGWQKPTSKLYTMYPIRKSSQVCLITCICNRNIQNTLHISAGRVCIPLSMLQGLNDMYRFWFKRSLTSGFVQSLLKSIILSLFLHGCSVRDARLSISVNKACLKHDRHGTHAKNHHDTWQKETNAWKWQIDLIWFVLPCHVRLSSVVNCIRVMTVLFSWAWSASHPALNQAGIGSSNGLSSIRQQETI